MTEDAMENAKIIYEASKPKIMEAAVSGRPFIRVYHCFDKGTTVIKTDLSVETNIKFHSIALYDALEQLCRENELTMACEKLNSSGEIFIIKWQKRPACCVIV